eukprot:gene9548-9712_t
MQPADNWGGLGKGATSGRRLSNSGRRTPDAKRSTKTYESDKVEVSQGCSPSSSALLVNGFFRTERQQLSDMRNVLVAATMSNDAYPFAKDFGIPMLEVVPGLNKSQLSGYQSKFRSKYTRLGASSVVFAHHYAPDGTAAGHGIIIGTPRHVFVVFRGTVDLGQVMTTANMGIATTTVFGVRLQLYQAPFRSVQGVFQQILKAVRAAVAATDNPAAAKLFLAGHSLGGASASFAALLLKEQGLKIGAVYNFGGYKMGTTCLPQQQCWVNLYDKHLGDVTWFWWHQQDPIPMLIDAALGTSFANSSWGHVPSNKHWMRIAGDTCFTATPNDPCPRAVDAADGAADGVCTDTILEQHYPWVYLQKIAKCALLTGGRNGQGQREVSRLDQCSRSAVWISLLGLPSIPAGL